MKCCSTALLNEPPVTMCINLYRKPKNLADDITLSVHREL